MRAKGILISVIWVLAAWAHAQRYTIPQIEDDADLTTLIGVANPHGDDVLVSVLGFGPGGAQFGKSASLTQIPAHGMVWMDVNELFGEQASEVAWIQVEGDESLRVLAEIRGDGTRSAYWSSSSLSEWLYMPHVAKNTSQFSTALSAVNGTAGSVYTSLTPSPSGDEVVLDALNVGFGKSHHDVLEFWTDVSEINWVFLSASEPAVSAMEYFTYNQEPRMASLSLDASRGKTLRFLHVATDTSNFWTGMVYINVGGFPANVVETCYDAAGAVIKSHEPEPLVAGGKTTLLFDAQNQERVPAGTSWVEVSSSQDLVGYALFGSINGGADATFAGIQGNYSGGTRLDYPVYAAEANMWTGYVAVNVGDQDARLVFRLFSDEGDVLGTHEVPNVLPRQKVALLGLNMFGVEANQLEGSWVQASASGSSWAGFALWGDQGHATRDVLCGVNAAISTNPELNQSSQDAFFGDQAYENVVLIEEFTASNCPYCGVAAREMEGFYRDDPYATAAVLRYGSWSSDPYYTVDNYEFIRARSSYYDVEGVPDFWVDGLLEKIGSGNVGGYIDYFVSERQQVDRPFQVTVKADPLESKVRVWVQYPSPMRVGDFTLRVAIVEKEYDFGTPPGTNGQSVFHGNMLLMLPDADGVALTESAGTLKKYVFTYDRDLINPHPPTQVVAIAFIQDDTDHEVLGTSTFGY